MLFSVDVSVVWGLPEDSSVEVTAVPSLLDSGKRGKRGWVSRRSIMADEVFYYSHVYSGGRFFVGFANWIPALDLRRDPSHGRYHISRVTCGNLISRDLGCISINVLERRPLWVWWPGTGMRREWEEAKSVCAALQCSLSSALTAAVHLLLRKWTAAASLQDPANTPERISEASHVKRSKSQK